MRRYLPLSVSRNHGTDAVIDLRVFPSPGTPTKSLISILRFNNFGWNFGGPIVHKKLFFFAGEEWKRIRQFANSQSLTLPTTAELAGDFRDLAPATGPRVTLRQPSTRPPGCTITNDVMSPQCIAWTRPAARAVFRMQSRGYSSCAETICGIRLCVFSFVGQEECRLEPADGYLKKMPAARAQPRHVNPLSRSVGC